MLVEALVAAAILLGGGAATLVAYTSTTRASHTAEREAEAVAIAEKELERIVAEPYAQIATCVTPAAGTGRSDDPGSWVQGAQLFVPRNFRPTSGYATPPPADLGAANRVALEPFVVSPAAGCIPPVADEIYSWMTVRLASFVRLDEIEVMAVAHLGAVGGFRPVADERGADTLGNRVVVIVDAVRGHSVQVVQDDTEEGVARARVRREPDDHRRLRGRGANVTPASGPHRPRLPSARAAPAGLRHPRARC